MVTITAVPSALNSYTPASAAELDIKAAVAVYIYEDPQTS